MDLFRNDFKQAKWRAKKADKSPHEIASREGRKVVG